MTLNKLHQGAQVKPHGNYKIELRDQIVHVYPTGGFNDIGIQLLRKSILELAPSTAPWALFEHPKNMAGLTPDAVNAIRESYKIFQENNCVAIALEISATWRDIFERDIVSHIQIPTFLGKDELELCSHLVESIEHN